MRGADLLARTLAAAGCDILFTLSGNQIMPLYEPLVGQSIRVVHARHEAAAVHMADAWGRLRGQPGVVLLTAGPGFANALTALYVAHMAESPVVLIAGASERANAGLGAFQEMDQTGLARRVAKAAWRADDVDRLGADLARAWRTALGGRPGPVCLSIPADVLRSPTAGAVRIPRPSAFASRATVPTMSTIHSILGQMRDAERPLILAGPALTRDAAWQEVADLARVLGAPALPMESPRGANDPALGGVRSIFSRADWVLLLGQRLDFALGFGRPPLFAPDVRFVQVEPESRWHRRDLRLGLATADEPRRLIRDLLGSATRRSARQRDGWLAEVNAALLRGRDGWLADEASDLAPLHPLRVMAAARTHLRSGDVFVSDGGEFGQWAQAGIAPPGWQPSRVINGPAGAIGGAIPFAIGARLARPEARVLAFSGDGAIGYHLAEIETAARERTPFVAIVGNDGQWNAEVQVQRGLGGGELACLHLGPAQYAAAAEALGGHGERVVAPHQLEGALARAVASNRPAIVDVAVQNLAAPAYRPAPHA